jgi:hypothetical protein
LSEFGSDEGTLELARKSLEERLFFKEFTDFVFAKKKVRNSQEKRFGRENIVGIGIGWKNWPEGPGMDERFFNDLIESYRRNAPDIFFPYYFFEVYLHYLRRRIYSANFGKPCIRVLVNKKVPEKLVEPDVVVSNVAKEAGLNIITDVIEVGEILPASNNATYRPVTCGVSGGNGLVRSGGTLGCVVKRKVDGKPLLLSCNHVLARANNATRHIDPVIQPSNLDYGTIAQKIGVLEDFEEIDFSGKINYVDAALVEVDSGIQLDPSMQGAHFVPNGFVKPNKQLLVKKVGRTTGQTFGIINGVSIGLQGMPIESPSGYQYARFEDIFSVVPVIEAFPGPTFAEEGDSGSLIVENDTNQAVGLLFGFSPAKNYVFGCSFSRICSKLGVEL